MEAIEIARQAVEVASDKMADNIVLLDAKEICSFADYFVICNGDSDRQVEAIRQEIGKALKEKGVIPHHCEGTADSGWILMDLGGVIIHILSPAKRDYYKLDDVLKGATPLVNIQ